MDWLTINWRCWKIFEVLKKQQNISIPSCSRITEKTALSLAQAKDNWFEWIEHLSLSFWVRFFTRECKTQKKWFPRLDFSGMQQFRSAIKRRGLFGASGAATRVLKGEWRVDLTETCRGAVVGSTKQAIGGGTDSNFASRRGELSDGAYCKRRTGYPCKRTWRAGTGWSAACTRFGSSDRPPDRRPAAGYSGSDRPAPAAIGLSTRFNIRFTFFWLVAHSQRQILSQGAEPWTIVMLGSHYPNLYCALKIYPIFLSCSPLGPLHSNGKKRST